ncbi:MAG TPA: Do family serine endopeptidase [Gemmatimonadaceae bacterium]|nr:Do family serine endopeptidase [Gemmatimonadaceae bacterium]
MSRLFARTRLGVVAAVAFAGGLVFAAGFNLTPFGYAQQGQKTPSAAVQSGTPNVITNNPFPAIAKRVTPAVVYIETERTASRRLRRPNGQNLPPDIEQFFRQFDPQQQQQQVPSMASGSGFIVSPDGYILTNNHVVADADVVNVTMLDKRVFKAKVIGRDPTTDVAVIKIQGSNFPTVPLGDDTQEQVGDWVLAIGNPLSLQFTVTAGIISAKGRSSPEFTQLYGSNYAVVDYIQTDAAINPGNSGGPLVNTQGEVIGINSAIASTTGLYAGYGFAIPITLAKRVMSDLIKYGHVNRALLGVSIQNVTPQTAQVAGLKEIHGALVGDFTDSSSPAKQAGIEPGDVITAIDGKPVDTDADLQRLILNYEPGQTVDVTVMRYGQQKTLKVKLGKVPSSEQVASSGDSGNESGPAAASTEKLGITVQAITPEMARQDSIPPEDRGVLVTDVDVQGTGYHNGLTRNVIITKVLGPGQQKVIRTPADLNAALQKLHSGDVISLLVYLPQQNRTVVLNVPIG